MMRDEQELKVSGRHLPLRIAAFALAFVVAVGAFAMGITGFGRRQTGYYSVEPDADDAVPLYRNGFSLIYWFEGSSGEIRRAMDEVKGVYGAALKRAYQLLDAEQTYEGLNNLATLNRSGGEPVTLDPALADALLDALERTRAGGGYNLFAGPYLAAWNELLYLEDPVPFDPLNDAGTRARLEALEAACADLTRFTLERTGPDTLRFQAEESVWETLAAWEASEAVLDFGLLHDAYLLAMVSAALEDAGYYDGYLTADSGLTVSLSGLREGAYALYSRDGGSVTRAATLEAGAGTAYSQLRAFALTAEEYGYYSFEQDGQTVDRCPAAAAGGAAGLPSAGLPSARLPSARLPSARLLSAGSVSAAGDVVEACARNIRLFACADRAAAEAFAAGTEEPVAWTWDDGERVVYTNAAGAAAVTAAEEYGYRVEKIP